MPADKKPGDSMKVKAKNGMEFSVRVPSPGPQDTASKAGARSIVVGVPRVLRGLSDVDVTGSVVRMGSFDFRAPTRHESGGKRTAVAQGMDSTSVRSGPS